MTDRTQTMENITLTKVGNGSAVHIYSEYTTSAFTLPTGETYEATTYKNTECGAVETGGLVNYGHRLRPLRVIGEGTIEDVTCKRCLKAYNSDAAREARENAAERAALAAGIEAGRPMIEDTVEAEIVAAKAAKSSANRAACLRDAASTARQRAKAQVHMFETDRLRAQADAFEASADKIEARLAQAATFRREAQGCRDERARSWEDSDSDGFLSQWANQEMAHRYDGAAKILEDGGTVVYHAVFNLDGEILDARESKGDYGMYYYVPSAEGKARYFTPSAASKEETAIKNNFKKGYYFGKARYAVTFDRFAAISKAGIEDMVEIVDNGQDKLRELGLL